MLLLGIDVGTSSIKVSVVDAKRNNAKHLPNIPKQSPRSFHRNQAGPNNRPKCGGNMYNRLLKKRMPAVHMIPPILALLVFRTRCMDL